MDTLRYAALTVLITTLVLLAGCGHGNNGTQANGHKPRCMEDMPCWNCKTMGNHKCSTARKTANTEYLYMPVAVKRATEAGYKCWLEKDTVDSSGITYLNWYCGDPNA